MTLNNMEREVLKAFVVAYEKRNANDFIVKLKDVKYPRGMNGPQKLEIHKSLRKKGVFIAADGNYSIYPTEELSQAAIDLIK